ncbi:MAG: FAD-dependent oxidoreductase [Pseudomonadota bacterium]
MRRIFSDYAYSEGPRDGCWWDKTVDMSAHPQLMGDVTCDVVVVGAGFTGLSAAYHLACSGASVVVLDANAVGWGASGRNGGFCCLGGGKISDVSLDKRYGHAARLAWRQAEKAAVDLVDTLITDLGLEVDRHSTGETCLAHRPSVARAFEQDLLAVRENYGVDAKILSRGALATAGMAGPFHGAMTIPVGFALNPRKYVAGICSAAKGAGVRVFEHSAVTDVLADGVLTRQGKVKADRVIIATNGYSSEDVPRAMAGRYMPTQSTVIVTRPLSEAEKLAQGWTTQQMCYDSRHMLHYFRLMPDDRFLFGMRGGLFSSPRTERHARARVVRDFRRLFPAWADVDIPFAWSGMVCLARNLVPFAGQLDERSNVLAGFAYHGNGVAMGTFTGKLLADLALGHAPELFPSVMARSPHHFPFAGMRRAIMPPVYGAFRLDDLRP